MIERATTARDLGEIRALFTAYAASLPIDLGLQHLDAELAALPGKYAPPAGALFLARDGDAAVGCVGLRPFDATRGEIKRMYVVPEARGQGLARALLATVIAEGRAIGYRTLVLDTLSSMTPAIALYEAAGFRRTDAYAPSPYADVAYFRLELG